MFRPWENSSDPVSSNWSLSRWKGLLKGKDIVISNGLSVWKRDQAERGGRKKNREIRK